MTDKVFIQGRWYRDMSTGYILHLKPGYYEPGVMPEPEDHDIKIDQHTVYSLITFLDEEGFIKPRLDERLRTEDLKFTHRLLDLLEQKVRNG